MKQLNKILSEKLAIPNLSIWIGAFLDVLVISIMNPYFPRFLLDQDIPVARIGLILSINVFLGFFSGIFWGKMADRFGRKPILIICRSGFFLSFLLLAFSSSMEMIIVSRIIEGLFSRNLQLILVIIGDITSPEERPQEMSKMGLAWIVGGLVGPLLGAFLYEQGAVFFGLSLALITFIPLLLTIFSIDETLSSKQRQSNQQKITKGEREPLFAFDLLQQPAPRQLLVKSFLSFMGHFMFYLSLTLFVSTRFEFSVYQISQLLTLRGVISLILRLFIFPQLLKKLPPKRVLQIGFALYLTAGIWLIFLSQTWEFLIITVLVSFAGNCSMDVITAIMSNEVSNERLGEMIGLNSAVESISLILSPILGSFFIGFPTNFYFGITMSGFALIPLLIDLINRNLQAQKIN